MSREVDKSFIDLLYRFTSKLIGQNVTTMVQENLQVGYESVQVFYEHI